MITKKLNTATLFKALADETRLSIVRKLAADGCEVPGSEIVASCAQFHQLSQPAISHHFSKLVAAGVLEERKKGTEKYYQLNSKLLVKSGIVPEKI